MDNTTKKPPSILFASRRGVQGYFQELRAEIKRVTWPTPRETTRLTGVVGVVCGIIVGLLLALSIIADFLLNFIVKGGR